METDINDDLVQKISKLEAVLVAGEDKINNEDIINLRAEIDINVNGRIAQIEQDLQKIGKQQTQLTETLQKLETASFNSKKLGRHLYYIIEDIINMFTNPYIYQNFNHFKKIKVQSKETLDLLKSENPDYFSKSDEERLNLLKSENPDYFSKS